MSKTQRIKGVLAPVVTPFDQDLNPDPARFIAHCKWLISQGSGLAAFDPDQFANSATDSRSLFDRGGLYAKPGGSIWCAIHPC